MCLFLKRGANQNAVDIEDKTPLSIAVEAANADIVTLWETHPNKFIYLFFYFNLKICVFSNRIYSDFIYCLIWVMTTHGLLTRQLCASFLLRLRLAKMNEEMRESEGPYTGLTGQYSSNSPTEIQYRQCIEEFIFLQLGDS